MAAKGEQDHYFPPGRSMARRVHGDRAVGLLYGQRALLIGALEPLTYTATMLSTRSGERPFERLARTARIQETILLGTREEADAALAVVHRMHRRVNGTLPTAAGPHAAGTRYSALDPELLLWTLAVIADSARTIYETLVRRLADSEREALWQDYLLFGELFGLPREAAPATFSEFQDWFEGRLSSPDLQATEHARELAPLFAFRQPVPLAARGNIAAQNHLIKGTLPARVRQVFGIRWTPLHEASFQAAAAAHRHSRPLVPRQLRRGRNDYFFSVVSRSERLRGGTKTPDVASA
jgi:uncharacterized protein (DUF2236 family)